ncbi:flocculation protein FLO11 isoform X2 [Drosophila busckii]|uniref:flocculation protein FLO11 isoform X2 n=1 Tax=Drosophila busckii TaxID=30019 RepID=UPI00083EA9A2|nr:flocculation protein FLO11 isoform X2 [Drosophila busckii]
MVNVPPPLLCSTPPPIDFGEDDDDSGLQSTLHLEDVDTDEFAEYGLVTEANAKAEIPIPTTELSNGHIKTAAAEPTAEAFNYELKAGDYQHMYQQQLPLEELEADAEVQAHDNMPSLKLDSLSLYSRSESVSPSGTLSPVSDEQSPATDEQAPVVTLQDITDDSDEECSPKKPKELYIPEGADNFFAIEIVGAKSAAPNPPAKPALNQINEVATAATQAAAEVQQCEVAATAAANEEFEADDDDFGDFADFSAAPAMETPPEPKPAQLQQPQPMELQSPDDGFDDFQDFATTTTTVEEPAIAASVAPVVSVANADIEEDDDDDFGDFSEPAFVPAPSATPTLPQPPPPAAAQLSLDERVKPILELMFPSLHTQEPATVNKLTPLADAQSLQFGGVEQAHALEYQWASSEMRHSLVRSLGIDSRNILFGDKWNSSMPRYAANLSYDPLKPLSATVATPLEPQPASMSSWQPNPAVATLEGLETVSASAATTETQASEATTQSGAAAGQDEINNASDDASEATDNSNNDAAAATSVFAAATTTATLSSTLSTDSNGHNFDSRAEFYEQQQPELRQTPLHSPTVSNNNNNNTYALPLKETHIYTPSKSDTAVAKTTTIAPIDFDYEIASAGIIIDETVVKKEYRDVEYKPPYSLEASKPAAAATGKAAAEDDDFSDFQSVPAVKANAQLQPPRIGTPTFGEQMILSPAVLLPQSIPLAKPSIEWGDNALASINAEEMARIEELFSKPPTISAAVAQQQPQEDDEWSDFVSVPVQQQPQQQQQLPPVSNHNNNVVKSKRQPATAAAAAAAVKDDDWSDFVSSTPVAATGGRTAPQFNSGAWQSANFYNNPLSLYKQQQQAPTHSNLVPQYNKTNGNSNSNNNNNNNNNSMPQQIHIMHDFSTAPTVATAATYQQQHHQHHQQQLQQQRQQFQLGHAKVAPRISLIPDMSFVAPTLPHNAGAFLNALPKSSFSAKK